MGVLTSRKMVVTVAALLMVVSGCSALVIGPASSRDASGSSVDLTGADLFPDLAGDSAGHVQVLALLDLSGMAGSTGLSGLRVTADGRRFTAVSDLGQSVSGVLNHDSSGRLTGIQEVSVRDLPVGQGDGAGRLTDAEELERLPDGRWLVAFERNHRIHRYDDDKGHPAGKPSVLVLPPEVADLAPNGGIEAMALLTDGRLVLLEEGEDDGAVRRRGWIGRVDARRATDWQELTYLAAPYYRTVAAAPTPGGGMLVLERQFSLLGGWGTRLVQITAEQLAGVASVASVSGAGMVLDGRELLRLERPFLNENFEGVATRPAPDGGLYVYLVADDNRSPFQRPYLMQLLLPARQSVAG